MAKDAPPAAGGDRSGPGSGSGNPGAAAPRDEEVVAALAAVFHRHTHVETQRRLKALVDAELQRRHPGATVGGQRLRVLAVRSGIVRLDITTRKGPRGEGRPEACPVCGGRVQRVRNRTLRGGSVLVGLRCRTCGYRTGKDTREPARYVFHRR